MNSICKGIKSYLHEVPDIDVVVCNIPKHSMGK